MRIDPGQGRGHHEHVKTAGVHSKFGIPRFEVAELRKLVKRPSRSNWHTCAQRERDSDPNNWRTVAGELVQIAEQFPAVETIDLGGGLGVPEKPGDKPMTVYGRCHPGRNQGSHTPGVDSGWNPGVTLWRGLVSC